MYYWILVKTAENKYLGWSKSETDGNAYSPVSEDKNV